MHALAIALLLATASTVTHGATIYRCELAPGKLEFRDSPCPGGGGAAAEFKDTTPQQQAAARASLANTREQAAALTERLEARTRAKIAAEERAARYAPAPIVVESAPVAEASGYPYGYPCAWAGCWPGYYRPPVKPHHVTPPPAPPPSVTIPPPIPANMRKPR